MLDESTYLKGVIPGKFFYLGVILVKAVTVTAAVILVINVWNHFMIPP